MRKKTAQTNVQQICPGAAKAGVGKRQARIAQAAAELTRPRGDRADMWGQHRLLSNRDERGD
jgi:hypothetical protein